VTILLIEYRVEDFDGWKEVFDQDPMGRAEHGVTRHWIYRDVENSDRHFLSLEFASPEEAKTFRQALQPVWETSGAKDAWVLTETED
jgi:hypothetical protein